MDAEVRRALIVEDEGSIRELVRFHLELAGFAVEEVADGRAALERARVEAFDLLVLDVMLPGLGHLPGGRRPLNGSRCSIRR